MLKLQVIVVMCCLVLYSYGQNVGIGTNAPNPNAVLDVRSTNKGVLFPMLTTDQRNAIPNPPNGLHIFNVEEKCLNYYDSSYSMWNCYCDSCQTVIITLSSSACKVDFYNSYAKFSPAKKYLVIVNAGVVIRGCSSKDTALNFANMPFNASVTIRNYGSIAGGGGTGGTGFSYSPVHPLCSIIGISSVNGEPGGHAIMTKANVTIAVTNYGVIAGGGGGGGGGGGISPGGIGGGGGGGAGILFGNGGLAGTASELSYCPPFNQLCCITSATATPGNPGTSILFGTGGAGALAQGGKGGNGGLRGSQGQNGTGSNFGIGGAAGKAIAGGSGNSIINVGIVQSFGIVD